MLHPTRSPAENGSSLNMDELDLDFKVIAGHILSNRPVLSGLPIYIYIIAGYILSNRPVLSGLPIDIYITS